MAESFAELEREVEAQGAASRRVAEQAGQAERSRRLIASSIMWLFVGLVILVAAAYVAAAVWPSFARLDAAAEKVRDLGNTLVLPIVTLVLGYYFGKRAE